MLTISPYFFYPNLPIFGVSKLVAVRSVECRYDSDVCVCDVEVLSSWSRGAQVILM